MLPAPALAVFLILAAPFVGSFLAVVAIRWLQGRTLWFGRSSCDACGHVLSARELVPIVSFVIQGARCRHCGARIDATHAFMETGALVVAVWAATVSSGWILLAACVLGWTLLTLATIDWRTGLLPDVMTLPLIVAGLIVSYLVDAEALVAHVVGAAGGFAGFAALSEAYRRLRGREGLGLGDAKLLAAGGSWLGWIGLPSVLLYAASIGLAAVLVRSLLGRKVRGGDRLAFGPPLAAAIWLVWLYGPLVPT
jgi:leader peptidase (prepilin peptidase)/N-methyltransferase